MILRKMGCVYFFDVFVGFWGDTLTHVFDKVITYFIFDYFVNNIELN